MAFIAGLALNLPGVWYLDALAGIAKTKPSSAAALPRIRVFNLIMFALVEIPIVAYLVNPQTRRRARHETCRIGFTPTPGRSRSCSQPPSVSGSSQKA